MHADRPSGGAAIEGRLGWLACDAERAVLAIQAHSGARGVPGRPRRLLARLVVWRAS